MAQQPRVAKEDPIDILVRQLVRTGVPEGSITRGQLVKALTRAADECEMTPGQVVSSVR
jgi:hypothetical protein